MRKFLMIAAVASLLPFAAQARDFKLDVQASKGVTNVQSASIGSVGLEGVSGTGAIIAGGALTGGTQSITSNGNAKASFNNGVSTTSHFGNVTSSGVNGTVALGGAVGITGTHFVGTSDDQAVSTFKLKTDRISVKLH